MKILKGIGVVVVLIVCVVGYFASQDDADHAEAGDCLKNSGSTVSPDLEVVDCGGTEATYKVVEVIPDTLDTAKCEGKSDVGYLEQTRGGRRSSGKQFVLCLDELKKK
ncbi:LppU/SCO3897 family protein [Streptomyces sp. NPDC054841]